VRAVVFEELGRVAVRDVADPAIVEPRDAIVHVTAAAICGSDLHLVNGKAPIDPGATIGHEALGVVDEVGPGVRRFRPGDRVVLAFDIACGACWFCRKGQTQLCEDLRILGYGPFGGNLGGAQAERVRVPVADVNLLAVPPGMEDERALFVGDTLTTGYYAANLAGAGPDDTLAVIGVGPVGFLCIQGALALGAGRVLALDREPERLALAERAGAEPVDVRTRDPEMAVAAATGDRGADAVIEAVGTSEAFEGAVEVVRRGGTVVVVGVYAGEEIPIQLGVYWARALRLQFAGLTPIHAWWERAMAEVVAGRIDPLSLISHRLPLSEASAGYELFDSRKATKVVLLP
jgi:alcohol dehydrogenase